MESPAEVDFFKEHENFDNMSLESREVADTNLIAAAKSTLNTETTTKITTITNTPDMLVNSGPSVQLSDAMSGAQTERKSTIGGRKVQGKRPGVSIL